MMKSVPSLEECKERFVKFGECEHHYQDWIRPYKCTTEIKTCLVCAKTFEKRYPTQNNIIKSEMMLALNGGVSDKQILYNIVAQKTDAPRPTIRRVARDLRNDLIQKVEVLSEKRQYREIATEYDCSECGGKKLIKKNDNRCPNCQVLLDWSDSNE